MQQRSLGPQAESGGTGLSIFALRVLVSWAESRHLAPPFSLFAEFPVTSVMSLF